MLLSWCLMSSDVIWHIRDKLWPMPKHGSIRKVYACLAVTCHLHFWQNDRDFLRATVVTRGWNGYRNKSQHRKSTLEKKILLPFQQGFEPATFQSRVRRSNHWAIPAPILIKFLFLSFSSTSSECETERKHYISCSETQIVAREKYFVVMSSSTIYNYHGKNIISPCSIDVCF